MTSPQSSFTSSSPAQSSSRRRTFRVAKRLGVATATVALATSLLPATGTSAHAAAKKRTVVPSTIVTPGNFTGFGFDQCVAPTQTSMTKWLRNSPFLAVGIYVSGNSRACRSQPNLSDTWVKKQLSDGWKVLPIVLGPQASCSSRYPKYRDDPTISAVKANGYAAATAQGKAEAVKSAVDVASYGIAKGSTIWYDLEAFDTGNTKCRESALRFVSAWNTQMRAQGYVPGFYSSAASGIRMIDDARVTRPGVFDLPSQIWIADWNGRADTNSTYIRSDGWANGARMKQYRGGHNETWGGVTINIDSNYLNFGTGSKITIPRPCGTTSMDLTRYRAITNVNRPTDQVKALQCALKVRGYYRGGTNGTMNNATQNAVTAFQRANGFAPTTRWTRPMWMKAFSAGTRPVSKVGSASTAVLRVQRALNSTSFGGVPVTGTHDSATRAAVIRYQKKVGLSPNGIVGPRMWAMLQSGRLR